MEQMDSMDSQMEEKKEDSQHDLCIEFCDHLFDTYFSNHDKQCTANTWKSGLDRLKTEYGHIAFGTGDLYRDHFLFDYMVRNIGPAGPIVDRERFVSVMMEQNNELDEDDWGDAMDSFR